jgi:hypothetical protein
MSTNPTSTRRSATTYRWIRQFHLRIGAWGALAAILYGITGLVMNHRFGLDAWPQGDSNELGKTSLVIPAEARATPEQLSLWLRAEQGLDAQVIRKGPPGKDGKPAKWTLGGGTASDSWSLDYVPGEERLELKRSSHTPLAALNRLHKGYGSRWWVLLADSFAIGMVLLGLTGMWMWARGRRPRDMLLSVMGLSALLFLAVVGLALL